MSGHTPHPEHEHVHAANCGHTALQHDDHVDYLHDGHLHHVHQDHIDEHALEAGSKNPASCENGHQCSAHDEKHEHATGCGHEPVPHADHVDHLVNGHLHHAHGSHCDSHGAVQTV